LATETHIKRYFYIIGLFVLASCVLVLSWPRLLASYRYLPVEIAIERYYTSREIPSDRLLVLIRFASEAVAHQDHYRFHDGLSLLHLLRAVDVATPALDRFGAYEAAVSEARLSLEQAPAQPAIWLRLANLNWTLHEEPEVILSPWKMSIFTGRTDSSLFAQRIDIGLAWRSSLDEEGVAMLRDQVLLAWKIQPSSLMGVLARRDRNLAITRPLIETTDPIALSEMETWLAKLR